jgi:NagD protein
LPSKRISLSGSEAIPSAAEFIAHLQDTGTPLLLLQTIRLTHPSDGVVKLRKFDIETLVKHGYTSALTTAEFVQGQRPRATASVIGEGGLLNVLNDLRYANRKDHPAA